LVLRFDPLTGVWLNLRLHQSSIGQLTKDANDIMLGRRLIAVKIKQYMPNLINTVAPVHAPHQLIGLGVDTVVSPGRLIEQCVPSPSAGGLKPHRYVRSQAWV
jgi:hypothetical protein